MPSRKYKKGGADEEDYLNLSSISGDEGHSLHLSDLQFDDSQQDLGESQNTTLESNSLFGDDVSFLNEPESQGSLHLSDLDENEGEGSLNTTTESIDGGSKKKTKKNTKKNKKTKKSKQIKKTKKTRKSKKINKKNKTNNFTRKNKRGGNNLENSIQLSEKHILPQDENPVY